MLKKVVLVTGSAGFIGFHLSKKLLEMDFKVLGLDGFTDYYDVNLKKIEIKFALVPKFYLNKLYFRE